MGEGRQQGPGPAGQPSSGGSVVLVSAALAAVGVPNYAGMSAAKAAVEGACVVCAGFGCGLGGAWGSCVVVRWHAGWVPVRRRAIRPCSCSPHVSVHRNWLATISAAPPRATPAGRPPPASTRPTAPTCPAARCCSPIRRPQAWRAPRRRPTRRAACASTASRRGWWRRARPPASWATSGSRCAPAAGPRGGARGRARRSSAARCRRPPSGASQQRREVVASQPTCPGWSLGQRTAEAWLV